MNIMTGPTSSMSETQRLMRETHIVGAKTRERIVPQSAALSKAGVLLAGLSEADDEFRFTRSNPAFAQFLVCMSGEGRVLEGNRWRGCLRGSAYVMPAWQPHAYHSVTGNPWVVAWVRFRASMDCPIDCPVPTVVRCDPRPVASLVRSMHREGVSHADPTALAAWAGILRLYVARAMRERTSGDVTWPIWRAVAADLARPWTNQQLADLALISTEQLRRLCHRQFGITPMQRVTQLRLRHAATLLAVTEQKLENIAQNVGYADRFAFSHAFKRHTGFSPAEFRRTRRSDPR